MKRWLIGLVVVFLLTIGCTYIFIPNRLKISRSVHIGANQQGIYRFLADKNNWAKWWHGTISDSGNSTPILTRGHYDFQINQILYNAFQIDLKNNNAHTGSLLQIFSYSVDNTKVQWSTELIAGVNPLRRIQQYFAAKEIDTHFKEILDVLKKHLSSLRNIYGIDIKKEKVQFQFLVSTKQSFSHYPTTQDIYTMVDKLRAYLNKAGGKTEYSPMLNIQTTDSANYVVQVALPVDKNIPGEGNISLKWMMKDGNILTGEVIGGVKRIDDSMQQFDKYISDYQRSIIAIPFQLLITDRLKEPDSTKWITRLYYPVI